MQINLVSVIYSLLKQQIGNRQMKDLHAQLEVFYLDYVNNFISASAFADHYGLETEHAKQLLEVARLIVLLGNIHK